MNEAELNQRRNYIDDLSRRLDRGQVTQEFYDKAFEEQYEIEKKFGLLKPGSWFWDSILDDLIDNNKVNPRDAQE